jgi:hypothetical protein
MEFDSINDKTDPLRAPAGMKTSSKSAGRYDSDTNRRSFNGQIISVKTMAGNI